MADGCKPIGGVGNAVKKFWTDEIQYLFDLNGYIVFENHFTQHKIEQLKQKLIEIDDLKSLPEPLTYGKPKTERVSYISNIAEASSAFRDIIKDKCINEVMRNTMGGYYRFNHSYAISHGLGGYTTMHMGGAPLHPKAIYTVQSGTIFSSLMKAVIPLENHTESDGCFCVVPGSHKANFKYGNEFNLRHPKDHPNCTPLAAKPGDLIIFTEALQHGGLENVSGRIRRTIYYCYSLGNVIDWGGDLRLSCSTNLINDSDDTIREIVSLKGRIK